MEKGQLIAVTGANGYIGSHVVKQLLLRGYRVRAIVRDPSNNAKVSHLKSLSPQDHLELAKGDLNEEDYKRAFAGCSAVLHVASPYIYSAEDPDRDIVQPAVAGTRHLHFRHSVICRIRLLIWELTLHVPLITI